jgi:hypothetical protein
MFRLVQACKTGGFPVSVESLKRVQTEDETAFCFGSSSLFLALRPTCNSEFIQKSGSLQVSCHHYYHQFHVCTTSPTFPFVLAFPNPKTRLAASRYIHALLAPCHCKSVRTLPPIVQVRDAWVTPTSNLQLMFENSTEYMYMCVDTKWT